MSDNENPQHPQQGGWQPVPQGGEYDAEATAFVRLPEELMGRGEPLAAPGQGYVPPVITPLTPAASADPSATGTWATPAVPPAGGAEAVRWPEPDAAQDPRATAHWDFADAERYADAQRYNASGAEARGPGDAGHGQAGSVPTASDLTGQWTIPVANGDLPDESGEFTTSALAAHWGASAPATLPGGATAPWATPGAADAAGAAGAADGEPSPWARPRSAWPQEPQGQRDPQGSQDSSGEHSGAPGAFQAPTGQWPDLAAVAEAAHNGAEGGAQAVAESAEPAQASHPRTAAERDTTPAAGSAADDERPHDEQEPQSEGQRAEVQGSERSPLRPGQQPHGGRPVGEPAGEPAHGEDHGGRPAPAEQPHAQATVGQQHPHGDHSDDTADATATTDAGAAEDTDSRHAHSEHPHASYVLRVNGADRPVTDAWIGESLLYVLRERLGLAGAKDGCSQGECGACAVQVDGRLVASCLVPAATAAGSEVRTVEGLAADGEPSDVQRALANCGAVQCGFCVPGMAMTVHDLLEGNHAPTELETRQALCGNLCRCSGYRGVLDAVREVIAERAANSATPEGGGAEEARIPHQAPPGAGGVQPPHAHPSHPTHPTHPTHPHDGGLA
ncbi:2Fe-2S iron-sulfur cluster-binding protein [Streptomyces sp. NPDC051219]|uniref:2Fe-2S iron-sulfur cluster-binding protein n=1 Tax=Streptomyces sp. NPDC051219 TaxID=3155283 RepID=UPI00342B44E4